MIFNYGLIMLGIFIVIIVVLKGIKESYMPIYLDGRSYVGGKDDSLYESAGQSWTCNQNYFNPTKHALVKPNIWGEMHDMN